MAVAAAIISWMPQHASTLALICRSVSTSLTSLLIPLRRVLGDDLLATAA